MNNPRYISQKALDILMEREGFYETPTNVDGIYKIGYGSIFYEDGYPVMVDDMPISQKKARILLQNLVKLYESTVHSALSTRVSQNQFDALVLTTYDIGIQRFINSNLLKLVNSTHMKEDLDLEFLIFCYKDELSIEEDELIKILVGDPFLTDKRIADYKIYMHGIY
jgi:GH24 family phage-related lysozyme (muramidase)